MKDVKQKLADRLFKYYKEEYLTDVIPDKALAARVAYMTDKINYAVFFGFVKSAFEENNRKENKTNGK